MENFISGEPCRGRRCQPIAAAETTTPGFPGCEFQIRDALADVLGKDKSEYFFDKVRTESHELSSVRTSEVQCTDRESAPAPPMHMQFLEHFFGEPDAAFFASLGLNCIRIAISYRHFEGQRAPASPSHNSQLATRHLAID